MRRAAKAYAFLDTNCLVQYQEFTQIDWRKVVSAKEVCIVITDVNLRELDKFKFDPRSQRRQKRARALLSRFRVIAPPGPDPQEHEVKGRPGVKLMVRPAAARTESYPGLRSDHEDDNLLAALMEFTEQLERDVDPKVVLVSSDAGVGYKAPTFGIAVIQLSDDYLLPPEPEEWSARFRALEEQVEKLRSERPLPELSLVGEDSDGVFKVNQQERNRELMSMFDSVSPRIGHLVERVELAYRSSPLESSRPTDHFGVMVSQLRHEISVPDHIRSRLYGYLRFLGVNLVPSALNPVDVYSDSIPLNWVETDPHGIDENWYKLVLELDRVCSADAQARFEAISDNSHVPLVFMLSNQGSAGLRGTQVEVTAARSSLSYKLPDFHEPRSQREMSPPALASLASDDREPAYATSDRLEANVGLIRPKQQVRLPVGQLVVPDEPGTMSVRVTVRADNLAEPLEQSYHFSFDAGKLNAEKSARRFKQYYGS